MIMNWNTGIAFATVENSRRFYNKASGASLAEDIIFILHLFFFIFSRWHLLTRLFRFFNFNFWILRNWISFVAFVCIHAWDFNWTINLNFWRTLSWSTFFVNIVPYLLTLTLSYIQNQPILVDQKFSFGLIISWKQGLICIKTFSRYYPWVSTSSHEEK